MQTDVVSEQEFERKADQMLHALERALSDREGLEVDLQSGILTIEFEDGSKFVVNSHRAARQIWMAAERSAWHFDYRKADDRWVAAKSEEELRATLSAVLTRKIGAEVKL